MAQVCRRLCSMRPGHARDSNCRHIEIRLPGAARVVSGHWWAVPAWGINALDHS